MLQLQAMARDPYTEVQRHLLSYKLPKDWPLSRDIEPIAPELIPRVYAQHRRATAWAEHWCSVKFQSATQNGATMRRYAQWMDYLFMYDSGGAEGNPLMRCSTEIICRDMYGLIKTFEKVRVENDLKQTQGNKAKVRHNWRKTYDPGQWDVGTIEITAADRHASTTARRQAAIDKAFENAGGDAPA